MRRARRRSGTARRAPAVVELGRRSERPAAARRRPRARGSAARAVAVDALGAEVLDHELTSSRPAKASRQASSRMSGPLRPISPPTNRKRIGPPARAAALGRREHLQVDAVGERRPRARRCEPGVEVHLAHVLARHPQLVDVARAPSSHSRGIDPNSHGWRMARRPEAGGARGRAATGGAPRRRPGGGAGGSTALPSRSHALQGTLEALESPGR